MRVRTQGDHTKLRPRGDFVFLGDSITNNTGLYTETPLVYTDGYPGHLVGAAGGAIRSVRNAGVSGNTSTQMLARFDTDVTPFAPGTVHVLAGTNDILASFTLATMQGNVRALVAKIRSIKALPVLCTIPPCASASTAQRLVLWQFNQWIRRYAQTQGLILLDLYTVLSTPAGGIIPAFDLDGTHPTIVGQLAMASYSASVLVPRLPGVAAPLIFEATDSYSMLPGALFTGAAVNGIAGSWVNYGNANLLGNTASVVTDALVPGNMQRITGASTTGAATVGQNVASSKFAVGDRLSIAAIVSSTGTTGTWFARVNASCNGAATNFYWQTTVPLTRELATFEFTVPTGTTSIDVTFRTGSTAGGNGTLDVGQFSMYNLTTLGSI